MATTTEHYALTKPAEEDFYDLADFNENMDTIDTALAAQAAETAGIGEKLTEMDGKIGTAADTGADTLFGRLSSGGSLIKSIQRVTTEPKTDETSHTVAIQEVNAAKCIVILERLQDHRTYAATGMNYTLTDTELQVSYAGFACNYTVFGFWIVEFY